MSAELGPAAMTAAKITPQQREQITALLFGLYPVLPAWIIRAWVSAATGTPRSVPVRSLTQDQAQSLISALRAAQARRRPSWRRQPGRHRAAA